MIDDKKYNKCFLYLIIAYYDRIVILFGTEFRTIKSFSNKINSSSTISSECRGYIDVDDECWRWFMLMTILR